MNKSILKKAAIILVLGILIGGFGYADMMYYLTDLPLEVDMAMYYIGDFMAFVGIVGIIYGLIAKGPAQPAPPTYAPPPTPQYAPPPPPQSQAPSCPTCGRPLELIQQYNRWYCRICQKYA